MPAVLFALAFYTKQSAISGAAATTLWLLARDWRTGMRFGITLAALVLVPFGLGTLLTGGGLFEHLVGYHELPHTGRRFMRSITQLTVEYWPLLVLSAAALAGSRTTLQRQQLGEMQVSPSGQQLALSLLTPPDGLQRGDAPARLVVRDRPVQ